MRAATTSEVKQARRSMAQRWSELAERAEALQRVPRPKAA